MLNSQLSQKGLKRKLPTPNKPCSCGEGCPSHFIAQYWFLLEAVVFPVMRYLCSLHDISVCVYLYKYIMYLCLHTDSVLNCMEFQHPYNNMYNEFMLNQYGTDVWYSDIWLLIPKKLFLKYTWGFCRTQSCIFKKPWTLWQCYFILFYALNGK